MFNECLLCQILLRLLERRSERQNLFLNEDHILRKRLKRGNKTVPACESFMKTFKQGKEIENNVSYGGFGGGW